MAGLQDAYARAATAVETNLLLLKQFAEESIASANAAIASLGNFQGFTNSPIPPSPPTIDEPDISGGTPSPPPSPSFVIPPIPNLGSPPTPIVVDTSGIDVNIGDFTPSIAGLTIPSPPAPIDTSGQPTEPTLADIDVPTSPDLVLPTLDALVQITIPDFVAPEFPDFDGVAPAYDLVPPSVLVNWTEPNYASENLDAVRQRISEMLAGDRGMPLAVEQAIYDRARAREDVTALKATQEAFDTFAGRGFNMPPGMLAAQVNAAQQNNQLQGNTLSRDVLVKAAEWQIENLRTAITQGIALEGLLINIFNNAAQRSFEIAKFQVESQVSLFNALVSAFNARQTAYQVAAQVYQTRVQAELGKVEVFKAQVEGEKAKAEINDQFVRVYQARIQAVGQQVELYRAQIAGAQAQSDLQRGKIEIFKAQIEAFAQVIAARKVEFDAYESQLKGEAAKAGIVEAEARAFAATVQAAEAKANVKVKVIEAQIEGFKADLAAFTANAEAQTANTRARTEVVQAQATAFSAQVSAYSAERTADTALKELQTRVVEGRVRNNIALYEVAIKEFDTAISRMIEQAKVQIAALEAAGRMASQLAAGAMAAINVGASISGDGRYSGSINTSLDVNHNVSYEAGAGESPPIIG